MHKVCLSAAALLIALTGMAPRAHAGNPLISHVYAADPSAHVWLGDDRLWLYTSHDQPGANTHDSMADFLEYRDDGAIIPIAPTTNGIAFDGVKPGPYRCTILLEAENGEAACGSLLETRVAAARLGFSGSDYVEGFNAPGNAVTVMAQVAKPCKARLRIRYLVPNGDETHTVMVNGALVIDPIHGETSWEKMIVFPKSEQWKTFDLGLVNLREGDNQIKFYAGRPGAIAVDCFEVEPVTQ